MGAGASSGAGQAGSHAAPRRGAPAAGPAATAGRIMAMNAQQGIGTELSRASVGAVDQPSPKHGPKHVVIQVADPKNFVYKGQRGGLLEKLKHVASQQNSPTHSAACSRAGSHAGSQAGSVKSHASRRDDFDVESDDEDLEGFIYDDESTSEDEREDYVNAFSRRKKVHKPDDYSEYEGANVRAMTAGGRQVPKSAAMRRGARAQSSDDDDDGDDEFDPEEERIRVLRQQKRQQEKLKAAAVAAHAAISLASEPGRNKKASGGELGSSTGGPAAAGSAAPLQPALHHPQPPHAHSHPHAHVRIAPTPPSEPPARGSSGNLRRGAAAAAAAASSSYGGGGSGGASGPGPGPGPASPSSGPGPGQGAGRGAGGRPTPPPAALSVNYGASASSQYWQAKRTQAAADEDEDDDKPPMSRLEQLQALQKKRLAQQERQRGDTDGSAGDGSGGGGVRWDVDGDSPSPKPPQQRPDVAQGRNGELRPAAAMAAQQQQEVRWQEPSGPVHHAPVHKTSSVKQFPTSDTDEAERAKYFRTNTSVASKQGPPADAIVRPSQAPPEQSQSGAAAPRTGSQGHRSIVIKHLEPPPRPFAPSPRASEGVSGISPQLPASKGLVQTKNSDDFDVDEMLNSFAPELPQQPRQQWAGGRPQPPAAPPPGRDPPDQMRSIRPVQSDFTSLRTSEAGETSGEVAGRIRSLPVAASRPVPNSPVMVAPSGQSVPSGMGGVAPGGPPANASMAAVAGSRFARLGANMTGPAAAGPPATAAWPSSNGGYPAAPPQCAASPLTTRMSNPSPFRVQSPSGSPLRLQRPPISSDGSGGGGPSTQASLSAPLCEATSGGVLVLGRRNSQLPAGRSPRASLTSGGGDGTGLLPVIRPGSGSSGSTSVGMRGSDCGGSNTKDTILGSVGAPSIGRSRFGAAPQQPPKPEAVRSSAPVLPSQRTTRDYDSDSALTWRNAGGPVGRPGWNGGGGGGGVGPGRPESGNGLRVGVTGTGTGMLAAGMGQAVLRSRLGQVGA